MSAREFTVADDRTYGLTIPLLRGFAQLLVVMLLRSSVLDMPATVRLSQRKVQRLTSVGNSVPLPLCCLLRISVLQMRADERSSVSTTILGKPARVALLTRFFDRGFVIFVGRWQGYVANLQPAPIVEVRHCQPFSVRHPARRQRPLPAASPCPQPRL